MIIGAISLTASESDEPTKLQRICFDDAKPGPECKLRLHHSRAPYDSELSQIGSESNEPARLQRACLDDAHTVELLQEHLRHLDPLLVVRWQLPQLPDELGDLLRNPLFSA